MQPSSSTETNVSEKTLIYGIERKAKYSFIPFSKREYCFISLIIVSLLIFLYLFICIVSTHHSTFNFNTNNEERICTSGPCLKISSFILNNMNKTQNPCDDFYKYVCGNFKNIYPANKKDINIFTIIGEKNKPRFHEMLLQDPPISRRYPNSAEWKMKQFYQSCLYGYQIIKNGGLPLLEILDDVGGWHVLATWNQSNFDLDKLFKQVHIKYWSPVIFDIHYVTNPENRNNSILTVKKVYHTPVHESNFLLKMESSYRRFVQSVVYMLIRDLKLEFTQKVLTENVNAFLDDQLAFLEKLNECCRATETPSETLSSITVEELQRKSNIINWEEFLQLKTGDQSLNGNTKIYSTDWKYLYNVSAILQQTSDRTLQNFFIWVLLEEYTQDLSFGYLYESSLYKTKVYNTVSRSYDQKEHCFNLLKKHMRDVLRYTFVSRLVGDEVKTELKSLIERINYHGAETISEFSWLKEKDKNVIKKRIQDRNIVGATEPLPNIEDLDTYYSVFQIKEKDYFYNRLELNNLHRHIFATHVIDPPDHQQNIGDLDLDYNFWQNRWYIPEEILQFPMFDKKYPNYLKYGGIGYILCFFNNYDILETVRSSDEELTEKIKNLGKRISRVLSERNDFHQFPINKGSNYDSYVASPYLSYSYLAYSYLAVRHLYKVYKSWLNENNFDEMLPGVPVKTPEQALFLFMTAARCKSYSPEKENIHDAGGITNSIRNSAILHSVPEFLEAFNCPKPNFHDDDDVLNI